MKILIILIFCLLPSSILNAKEDCLPCTISFFNLLPSPKDYDELVIQIIGVARELDGKWYLFATQDAAEFFILEQSIEFNVKGAGIDTPLKKYDYVHIQGVFTADVDDMNYRVRGKIYMDVNISVLNREDYR